MPCDRLNYGDWEIKATGDETGFIETGDVGLEEPLCVSNFSDQDNRISKLLSAAF